MKIVADIDIPFLHNVLEPYAQVVYAKGDAIHSQIVADADVLIVRTRTLCDEELLAGSSVKMICTATIGFDHIDMEYCHSAGIEVITSAGCNARGVLQWVAAALSQLVGEGRPADHTLGVVGVGNVGRLVAEYGRAWGFTVLCCDPPRHRAEGGDFVSLDEVAHRSDIVTFHVPLTRGGEDNTFHMADSRFFELMKPDAVVLNAARGEVIDSGAMLHSGLQFVADTWENEPLIDPLMCSRAMFATPHIAGYTVQGKANATAIVVGAIALRMDLQLLEGWYPEGVARQTPRPISWSQMRESMDSYFDIAAESRALKNDPSQFESLRNNYKYRTEFF